MPLARYVNLNQISGRDAFALEAFVKYHISAFRMQKDGQISAIKHSTFGWMSPERYYLLQHIHDIPWGAVVDGGYRINQVIYGLSFEIAAFGFEIPIPLGPAIVGLTCIEIAVAALTGDWQTVVILAAALLAPFGAIYLLYHIGQEVLGIFYTDPRAAIKLATATQSATDQIAAALKADFGPPAPPIGDVALRGAIAGQRGLSG